jgi:hypothetical protein
MNMMRVYRLVILMFVATACETNDQPLLLSSGDANAESVYFTRDENDLPVVAWTERSDDGLRFHYAILDAHGTAVKERVNVSIPSEIATHAEGMPKIAFKKDGTVIAGYETKAPTKENKFAGAVMYTISNDRGKSWARPMFVHSDTVAGRSRSFFDFEQLPDGEVGAAWLDINVTKDKKGRSVRFARTTKGGGFSNEILIDSAACECCRMDVYADASGRVHIAYRGLALGTMGRTIRDIALATSSDQGRTFGVSQRISADNWAIDGCPHTGPSLTSDATFLHALWYTEGGSTGVFYAATPATKAVFSARESIASSGKHPQMCASDQSISMVWEESEGVGSPTRSRIKYQLRQGFDVQAGFLTPADQDAYYPVVSKANGGFAIAYMARVDGTTQVFVRTLSSL